MAQLRAADFDGNVTLAKDIANTIVRHSYEVFYPSGLTSAHISVLVADSRLEYLCPL
jgi:hypothetical protein